MELVSPERYLFFVNLDTLNYKLTFYILAELILKIVELKIEILKT